MLPGGRGGDLIIIAAIALIVVGPKNLPKVLREVGRWVGKMRRMADEFRSAFDDMARQSELDELRKEVEALRQGQPFNDIQSQMNAYSSDIEQGLKNPTTPPYTPPMTPPEPQMEGLPPGTPADVAPVDGAPPAVMPDSSPQIEPTVVVKKPRARKKAAP